MILQLESGQSALGEKVSKFYEKEHFFHQILLVDILYRQFVK